MSLFCLCGGHKKLSVLMLLMCRLQKHVVCSFLSCIFGRDKGKLYVSILLMNMGTSHTHGSVRGHAVIWKSHKKAVCPCSSCLCVHHFSRLLVVVMLLMWKSHRQVFSSHLAQWESHKQAACLR